MVVIGAVVALAVIGHATNIIPGSAVPLQAAAMTVTGSAAGIWLAYSVGGGFYDVALAAAAMLSMAGIVVAAAILTPIGMPTVPTWPTLMAILPILSISTNSMDSFVIGLLMPIDIVVTNAIVLLDLAVGTNAIVLLDLV